MPTELTASADQATPRAFALLMEKQQEQGNTLDQIKAMVERLETSQRAQLVEPETAEQVARLDRLETALRKAEQAEKHGPLVRAAMWLEQLLRRGGRS